MFGLSSDGSFAMPAASQYQYWLLCCALQDGIVNAGAVTNAAYEEPGMKTVA